jgi:hypothetical protein
MLMLRLKFEHDLSVKNPFTGQTFMVNSSQTFALDPVTGIYAIIPSQLVGIPPLISDLDRNNMFVLMNDLDAGWFEEIL